MKVRDSDGFAIDLELDEIVSADPNGFTTLDGKFEYTVSLYLKTWKPGGRRNYSPGIACTVLVLESDLAKAWPELGKKIKETRAAIARQPDPDHGSCS